MSAAAVSAAAVLSAAAVSAAAEAEATAEAAEAAAAVATALAAWWRRGGLAGPVPPATAESWAAPSASEWCTNFGMHARALTEWPVVRHV